MPFARVSLRVAVLALAMPALGAGCEVRLAERPRPAAGPVIYEPLYYHDYVVYFDDAGLPYYWLDGRVVHVSSAEPEYAPLVRHYRAHGDAYRMWNRAHGRHRYVKRDDWQRRSR